MKKFFLFSLLCLVGMGSAQAEPISYGDGWYGYCDPDMEIDAHSYCTDYGIMFPAGSVSGWLTEVSFLSAITSHFTYTESLSLRIYLGGDVPEEENLVYEQEIDPGELTQGNWTHVSIMYYDEPIVGTESTKNLWITLHYDSEGNQPIAPVAWYSYDVDPNGCWNKFSGEWGQRDNNQSFALVAHFEPFIPTENLIWSETFEGGVMPQGWTVDPAMDHVNAWKVGTGDFYEYTGAHSGQYNALRTHTDRGDVQKLITPVLDLSNYYNVTLGFWFINRMYGTDTDAFTIYYRNTPDGEWNELGGTTLAYEQWTWAYLTPSNGVLSSTFQIAFEMSDNYGYGIGLDDIYITGQVLPDPSPTPSGVAVTVGSATTTCASVPFFGLYGDEYHRAQYIIPAEKLTSLVGKKIQALRWYLINTTIKDYGNTRIDLYLKEVGETTLSEFVAKEEDDIVYQGNVSVGYMGDRNSGLTLELDKDFVYEGGNLLIGIDNTVMGEFKSTYWLGETVEDASVSGYSYTGLEDVAPTQRDFIPLTTFYYEDETGIEEIYEGQMYDVRNEGAMYDVRSRKILHDGHLFILRNGKLFNATGVKVK